jgi:two-component system response regulator PhoP
VRVLIVEDEVRLAENLGEALREGAGFAIDHARTDRENLALNSHYDAIILDSCSPARTGCPCCGICAIEKTRPSDFDGSRRHRFIIKLLNPARTTTDQALRSGRAHGTSQVLIRRGKVEAAQLKLLILEMNTVEQRVGI